MQSFSYKRYMLGWYVKICIGLCWRIITFPFYDLFVYVFNLSFHFFNSYFQVYATWNNSTMTIRNGEAMDSFTIFNGTPWDNGMYYYTNLPFDVQRRFPMYGTTDINTGNTNILVLSRSMISFLIRHRSWNPVPLDGWKLISSGNYLGPLITDGNIDMYEKTFSKGTYIIDNDSAMYLFSDILDNP